MFHMGYLAGTRDNLAENWQIETPETTCEKLTLANFHIVPICVCARVCVRACVKWITGTACSLCNVSSLHSYCTDSVYISSSTEIARCFYRGIMY
jgi:hypothetical protein